MRRASSWRTDTSAFPKARPVPHRYRRPWLHSGALSIRRNLPLSPVMIFGTCSASGMVMDGQSNPVGDALLKRGRIGIKTQRNCVSGIRSRPDPGRQPDKPPALRRRRRGGWRARRASRCGAGISSLPPGSARAPDRWRDRAVPDGDGPASGSVTLRRPLPVLGEAGLEAGIGLTSPAHPPCRKPHERFRMPKIFSTLARTRRMARVRSVIRR